MTYEKELMIDLERLSSQIKKWFLVHEWELEDLEAVGMVAFKARKKNLLSVTFPTAPSSVSVICYHDHHHTKVMVKECGWDEKLKNNLSWLLVTGGSNMSMKNRHVQVSSDFEKYVEGVLHSYGNVMSTPR